MNNFLLKLLLFIPFFLIRISKCEDLTCNKTHPILKDKICDLIYCSDQEYNSSICKINNEIIKTQWLTNLIQINDIKHRYIHPFLTSNNDLIIQTSDECGLGDRYYYGLTNEGRFFFTNSEDEESPYFSIAVTNTSQDTFKYEGIATSIQIENDENNYFLSIGIGNGYAELIDYKNKKMTRKLSKEFYYMPIISEVSCIFLMTKIPISNDQKKYYILSFITRFDGDTQCYMMVKIYNFTSPDITNDYLRVIHKYVECVDRRITSCFQSLTKYNIFCFFQDNDYYFSVVVFEPDLSLSNKKVGIIDSGETGDGNEFIFFKGVYLVNYVGFYLYYKSISSTSPYVAIREWGGSTIFTQFKNYEIFELNKYNFNSNLQLNDLIKIKDYQICFASISENKDILYITIFNFYSDYTELTIRYYIFPIFELYHKFFHLELKLTQWGNFLTLVSSFCFTEICSSNSNEHYSYLTIFGYPNSTDIDFNYIEYLSENNQNIENNRINLRKYIGEGKIDNNIFGYVFKGVKILSVPDNINIKSITNDVDITNDYYLNENDITSISISLDNQNTKEEYIVKYAIVYSDPDYEDLYNYVTNMDLNYDQGDESNYYYDDEYIDEYVGRTSYLTIIKNGELTTECENEYCSLCKKETNILSCITCTGDYTISNGEKICSIPIETTLPLIQTTIINFEDNSEVLTNQTENQAFSIVDYLVNKYQGKITNEQYDEICQYLKDIFKNNYTNENILLKTENVIFQLCSLRDQNNQSKDFLNVSNVDLDECEKILKNKENLTDEDDLIILKTDIKIDELKISYIQYEIYHPYSKNKLDLDICSNVSIYINAPISISSDLESLYNSLINSGYNLFNSSDSFYNDICSTYTSEKGADISLNDRKNEIYNKIKNNTLCQNNCTFMSYNSTAKKSKCECTVQTEDIKSNFNIQNIKNLITDSLINTLKNANFLVLKCYKLIFSLKDIIKNIGFYIMTLLFLGNNALMILYFILGGKKTHQLILEIIFYKKNSDIIKNIKKSKNLKTEIKPKNNNNKIKIYQAKIASKDTKKLKNSINNNKENNINLIKHRRLKSKNEPPSKKKNNKKRFNNSSSNLYKSNNKIKISNTNESTIEKKAKKFLNSNSINNNESIKQKNNKSKFYKNEINNNRNIYFSSVDIIKIQKKNSNLNKEYNYLNDQELNTLPYELAIKLDKRSYFEYYFSLLKKKHLILFTFSPSKDYNLIYIKISLFLISFSLYFTVNGFFFTDESMHNVYINNGNFDIFYQFSQIIYSSLIPSILYAILRLLSLSENDILKLKQEKNLTDMIQKSENVENCLKVKCIIFYIASFLIMGFFWYYISCFCAVYKNTQIILIEDTLISFGISMIYPCAINLLPGIFRIPALRDSKKNKKCIYKTSIYISFI